MVVTVPVEDESIEVGSDAVRLVEHIVPLKEKVVGEAGEARTRRGNINGRNRFLSTIRVPIVPSTGGENWIDLLELQVAVISGRAD